MRGKDKDTEYGSPATTPTSSVVESPEPTTTRTKRGRPRKELVPPSYDDFPVSGTAEQQKHWMKMKSVQYWRYQKLSGPGGEDYRKQESTRVGRLYNRKKLVEEFNSGDEEEKLDDVDVTEEKAEKVKEQNRARFVKSIFIK